MNIQYIAGVFDARGSVGLCRTKRRNITGYYIQLRLSGVSEQTLEYIREYLGRGSIQPRTDWTFCYMVASKSAAQVAEMLLPYSIDNKSQLEIVIDHYNMTTKFGKEIRAAGRYHPELLDDLRSQQESAHESLRKRLIANTNASNRL